MPTVIMKTPSPSPRNGAIIVSTSCWYGVSAISIPASSAPTIGDRPARLVSSPATITTSRLAARNTSGLLARAAWAKMWGRARRPPSHSAATASAPPAGGPRQPVPRAARLRGERAQHEDDRHDRQILEQQHGEGGAAPTALWVPASGSTSAVDESGQRQAQADRAGDRLAQRQERQADDRAGAQQLRRADAEDQAAHRPQPPEGQLQPDGEEEEDDAELRHRLDRAGLGNGDVGQPGQGFDLAAQPERADGHADQDEADDRADPQPGEQRDDEPRRAQDDERVGQAEGGGGVEHPGMVGQGAAEGNGVGGPPRHGDRCETAGTSSSSPRKRG